jgi:hypothetical protein
MTIAVIRLQRERLPCSEPDWMILNPAESASTAANGRIQSLSVWSRDQSRMLI